MYVLLIRIDCMKTTVTNTRMITTNVITNNNMLTVSTSTNAVTTAKATSMVTMPSANMATPVKTTGIRNFNYVTSYPFICTCVTIVYICIIKYAST